MNTAATPKKKLIIRARHIGPIMQIDQELSDEKQNLIFARNGSGKSFLARALRSLDETVLEGVQSAQLSDLLVSDESPQGTGEFMLFEDANCIGGLRLDTKSKRVDFEHSQYIFHVFSDEYVDFHLRQKNFELDGKINHQIIVGRENVQLDELIIKLDEKRSIARQNRVDFEKRFLSSRDKIQKDFQINARLGAFSSLSSQRCLLDDTTEADERVNTSIADLLAKYNKLKSLPADPTLPHSPTSVELGLDFSEIEFTLKRVTSPSSIEKSIKDRIESKPEFFRSGLELSDVENSNCPFCTQSLNDVAIGAISMYREYFEDEEARHRDDLNSHIRTVQSAQKKARGILNEHLAAKSRFDDLRAFFPSMLDQNADDVASDLGKVESSLSDLVTKLLEKLRNLAKDVDAVQVNITELLENVEAARIRNQGLFQSLAKLVENSNSERRTIQGNACAAFELDFCKSESEKIAVIKALDKEVDKLDAEVAELRKTQGEKADARTRVADTFSVLLNRFFSGKYSFDSTTFKVLRERQHMARGSDRTLSDGEKSVIAFCYFLAQSHLRVSSNEDYSRLYFVFDDPVTSMSFDYVYAIVQTLKNLRVGEAGEVVFNPKSPHSRPRMLVLTHNNYFYNVSSINNAVKKRGLFQLVPGANGHRIASQRGFATAHEQQLNHVRDVSEGLIPPDHQTPNCVRSVIESIWRFCRPDIQDFEGFLQYLIDERGIEIRSVLINDLSHGGKFEEPLHKEEDIIQATIEAVAVVELFAEGQLKKRS